MEPFLCPHDDFRSMSIRELALDFGDFPSSANVVKTPKRLADFKVLTIAKITGNEGFCDMDYISYSLFIGITVIRSSEII